MSDHTADMKPEDVLTVWIGAGRKAWFSKDAAFDAQLAVSLGAAHLAASRGAFDGWTATPRGALALILLLDQIPRNIYRDSPHAFATDALALIAAQTAIGAGLDQELDLTLQPFIYLPFEHAESAAAQARSIQLFNAYVGRGGEADYLRYAQLHAGIIDRFGRFPHRNRILGRVSTPEELAFLSAGGFSG